MPPAFSDSRTSRTRLPKSSMTLSGGRPSSRVSPGSGSPRPSSMMSCMPPSSEAFITLMR